MLRSLSLVALALLVLSPRPALAQPGYGSETGLTGNGSVPIERQAELLRMEVQLLATASSMKDALAVLKKRQDSATAQVVALGADKDSIAFEPAQIHIEQGNRAQQMQILMRQRMQGGGGRKKPTTPPAEPVRVACTFRVDWKLKAGDHDQLLTTSYELQQKLKSLDLAGASDATKLSAEEQELLEEAESEMGMYGEMDQEKPGQPQFYFLAKISDAEYEAALAKAVELAHTRAQRLAKAAGRELGELRSLYAGSSSVDGEDYEMYQMMGRGAYRGLQALQQKVESEDELLAIGLAPGKVDYTVNVTAAYDFK